MKYTTLLITAAIILGFYACNTGFKDTITPNDFKGSDIERIQAAVNAAKETTQKVVIPQKNANGRNSWIIDSAILLPSNMTVVLDNCIIQLSDSCRDNMFRSDNVGIGITDPEWNHNIHLVGIGNVVLKGANNPRATGDSYRTLTMEPEKIKLWSIDSADNVGRVSYGSDAGKEGRRQMGDWRNIMILIAQVDGFSLKNLKIENSHSWAVSFERSHNVEIDGIRIYNPETMMINGVQKKVHNKDGINLRQGCKYFRINNISGLNGDDIIALSSLDVAPYFHTPGDIASYQVTSTKWYGPQDDTEQVWIRNVQTNYGGVAIRASGDSGIHHVYIDGVMTQDRPDTPPPYGGSRFSVMVSGLKYGEPSMPGKINNIYAMNLIGDGKSLIKIEAPVEDCAFMNGIYTGQASSATLYTVDKETTKNVQITNVIKTSD